MNRGNYTDVKELISNDPEVSSCDLAGGMVNNKIFEAFEDIDFNLHFGGCNSCTVVDKEDLDKEVFSVVQQKGDEVDSVYINYAVSDMERTEDIGHELASKLNRSENDVTVEWNGDPRKCITVKA